MVAVGHDGELAAVTLDATAGTFSLGVSLILAIFPKLVWLAVDGTRILR
jgi:hypothetical protein